MGDPTPTQNSSPSKRGFPLYVFLIVVAIIIIAAVAFQIMRQSRGNVNWNTIGMTPANAMPRCLMPGATAQVRGRVDVFPGIPGFTDRCYSQTFHVPTTAKDAVNILADKQAAIADACGGGSGGGNSRGSGVWFQGIGKYTCGNSKSLQGRSEGFSWADWGENTQRENFETAAAAAAEESDVNRTSEGTVEAFVNDYDQYRRNSRERYCGSGSDYGDCGGYGDSAQEDANNAEAAALRTEEALGGAFAENVGREGFSPDVAGSCSGTSPEWKKRQGAAQAELEAIMVMTGRL